MYLFLEGHASAWPHEIQSFLKIINLFIYVSPFGSWEFEILKSLFFSSFFCFKVF